MQKRISKVLKMFHGHAMLEFEDGSKQTVFRADHDAHQPQVGQMWPPDGHEHAGEGVHNGALRAVK